MNKIDEDENIEDEEKEKKIRCWWYIVRLNRPA